MKNNERTVEIFTETGVLQQGHFALTSGRHSDQYMQCARVFQYAWYAEELCRELAGQFSGQAVDLVVGPAVGAVQMTYEVGRQLHCRNLFTEREEGKMTLRRGFAVEPGQKVLVVEDTVTTGGSVREVIEVVKACGGEVIGVGCLVDRSGGKVDFGVPLYAVYRADIASWPPEECPLCQKGVPITKPGSRKTT